MEPVLDCLSILGRIRPAKSTMIILSDQYFASSLHNIMWAPAAWTARCWTLGEKRQWVEMVKLAIEQT